MSGSKIKITVTVADQDVDVEAPADTPVSSWMPELIDTLTAHDVLPGNSARYVVWFRRGGVTLRPMQSLAEQGVTTGSRLWCHAPPPAEVQITAIAPSTVEPDGTVVSVPPVLMGCACALLMGAQIAVGRAADGLLAIVLPLVLLFAQLALTLTLGLRLRSSSVAARSVWWIAVVAATVSAISFGLAVARVDTVFTWPLAISTPLCAVGITLAAFTKKHGPLGVYVLLVSVFLYAAGLLDVLRVLDERAAFATTMLLAVVVASASHRLAVAITGEGGRPNDAREKAEAMYGPRTPPTLAATVIDDAAIRTRRLRAVQAAILASSATIIAFGGLLNNGSPFAVIFDVVCVLAIIRLLLLSGDPGLRFVVPVTVAAGCVIAADPAFPVVAPVFGFVGIALGVVALFLQPALRSSAHFGEVLLVRSRLPLLATSFGLFVAEVGGWQKAWEAGRYVGDLLH